MKRLVYLPLVAWLVAGCASTSTVESRKQERYGVYAALTPETKTAVDQGQIKAGMSQDAVYIAWGKPAQVLATETAQGKLVTWLYHSAQLVEYRYWTYHHYHYRNHYWGHPWLAIDYYPQRFVSAEVVFENGLVKEWRTLPAPVY